jgi:hypothetical protein
MQPRMQKMMSDLMDKVEQMVSEETKKSPTAAGK